MTDDDVQLFRRLVGDATPLKTEPRAPALRRRPKPRARFARADEARVLDESLAADIEMLKRKVDNGAKRAITQFFFEAETFLRFRDYCAKAGITAPITPGILPIINWKSARTFAERCGADIPLWLDQAFDAAIRDDRHDLLAKALCTELCSDLVDEGVDSLHFYTLNRSELTVAICHALGVRSAAAAA